MKGESGFASGTMKSSHVEMKIKAFVKYHFMLILETFSLMMLYPYCRIKFASRNIWLITERGTDARDNGFHLFRYIRKEHPEIDAYYVLSKNSEDLHNVQELGNLVDFKSLEHKILYCAASILINTQVTSSVSPFPYFDTAFRHKAFFRNKKYIGLKHGVDKDDYPIWHKENAKLDLVFCGAKPEYDYERATFHYSTDEIMYTGLARFDALQSTASLDSKIILIMPTWRAYLSSANRQSFLQSLYYKKWNSLINHKNLEAISKRFNIDIVFYLHTEFQKYAECFKSDNEHVRIAHQQQDDVQDLLKKSHILITDYSSVFFDFAFMNKPVCYFQFDYAEFRRKQYKEGYFDYKTMGFGPVCTSEKEICVFLQKTLNNEMIMESRYIERTKAFFPLRDTNNCKRIFEAISKVSGDTSR